MSDFNFIKPATMVFGAFLIMLGQGCMFNYTTFIGLAVLSCIFIEDNRQD